MPDSKDKDINPQIGGPTQFDKTNEYRVGQHTYPSDLFSNVREYGGNYVIFYVNVAEDSRILKGGGQKTVSAAAVSSRKRGMNSEQEFNSYQAVAGATGAQVVTIAAAALAGAEAAGKGIVNVAKGAIKGAALAMAAPVLGAGIVSLAAGYKMARQQKRLSNAIALHIPNSLQTRYSMAWDAEETAAFQMAARVGTDVFKAIVTLGTKSNASATSSAAGTVGAIATNLALSKGPQGAALSSASGLAANPKKEQVFKNVDFRTFSFEYSFFPRNSDESDKIKEIIKMFKLHMHPEYKDSNGFLFIYPSEFDIFYYINGAENMNLNRHTSCVLTDMNVNYTPNSMFNAFENGMPTQINISLTFKELSILTKKDIEDNF
jgi:hypothetical protein